MSHTAERELILLRGLPGSGKSTLAKALADGKYPVYSNDDYFTSESDGKYAFEFDKNHIAYKQCQDRTRQAMEKGVEKIFVDNTFTLDWELEPYFKLAAEFGYRLHVITVENYHGGKNVHEVTGEQMRKMAEKYKVKLM